MTTRESDLALSIPKISPSVCEVLPGSCPPIRTLAMMDSHAIPSRETRADE
jgi:hypothetical protein